MKPQYKNEALAALYADRVHDAKDPATVRLLSLSELPESHLTTSELAELDAFVAKGVAEVRDCWTPRDEAMRRGIDLGTATRFAKSVQHDDRYFAPDVETMLCVAPSDDATEYEAEHEITPSGHDKAEASQRR